jgi:ethanolamine utilization protein EutA
MTPLDRQPAGTAAAARDDPACADRENPDRLSLLTVGIDIGTSTSHLVISRLVMRRLGKSMQSRWVVAEREALYLSPVMLTPYLEDFSIDAELLREFFAAAFEQAGVAPGAIDTGAVVLTGEAVRRRNARAIADLFAHAAGRFVCATAGHRLEALVSGYGSGAAALARRTGEVVLNIDIGGGTSKFALASGRGISAVAAVNVGGRLIAFDERRRITRIEPAARQVAAELGIELRLGDPLPAGHEERITERMADCLVDAILPGAMQPLTSSLMLTDPLPACAPQRVTLSGGVAEYARDPAAPAFGDMGPRLAARARERLAAALGVPAEPAEEQLRATVVGLSQFTVQVSGDTIFVDERGPLPVRNLPVVTVTVDAEPAASSVAALTAGALRQRELDPADQAVALSVRWHGRPAYPSLRELASGIAQALAGGVTAGHPLVVCVSQDCASGLGHLLSRAAGPSGQVVCVDGLDLADFDFIDIGMRVTGRPVVPVVVKTLVFPDADPRGSEVQEVHPSERRG